MHAQDAGQKELMFVLCLLCLPGTVLDALQMLPFKPCDNLVPWVRKLVR